LAGLIREELDLIPERCCWAHGDGAKLIYAGRVGTGMSETGHRPSRSGRRGNPDYRSQDRPRTAYYGGGARWPKCPSFVPKWRANILNAVTFAIGGAAVGGPVGAVVGGVGGAAVGNSMTHHRHYGYAYYPYHHYHHHHHRYYYEDR
jgi:hypothetical protein